MRLYQLVESKIEDIIPSKVRSYMLGKALALMVSSGKYGSIKLVRVEILPSPTKIESNVWIAIVTSRAVPGIVSSFKTALKNVKISLFGYSEREISFSPTGEPIYSYMFDFEDFDGATYDADSFRKGWASSNPPEWTNLEV